MPQPRRRDGRPVETVPASSSAPPEPTGTGASGLTAAVLGPALFGGLGAAATVDVASLPTAQAVTLSAAAILQAFERFLDVRALESEADVLDALAEEYADVDEFDRLEAVTDETAFDRAYRGKARARLDRDLPVALSIADEATRELEVRKILERETRYANQREAALQGRALGALEARILESKSPAGARWELGNTRTHTKDCLAMAGKVWPWTVLRSIRPPLHHGCDCRLVQPAPVELESAERLSIADMAFAAMAVAESLEVVLDEDELRRDLLVMEARYDNRFGAGTTKGGQFKPKRGGVPGRPTGARMHRRRRRMDLLELPDAPVARASVPEPQRKASKRGREVQVGDVVLAGGEWRHVEAVNPSVPGLVELSGLGLSALDPDREYDVGASHGHDHEPGARELPEPARRAIDRARTAVRKVLPGFEMPRVVTLPDGDAATARSLRDGTIGIHPDSGEDTIALAVIHEVAHHLDRSVLGTEDDWGTQQSDRFDALYRALRASPTIKRLEADEVEIMRGDERGRRELLQGLEMVARAFEQLVAERSGDEALKRSIDRVVADPLLGFQYWQADEWRALRPEVARFFGAVHGHDHEPPAADGERLTLKPEGKGLSRAKAIDAGRAVIADVARDLGVTGDLPELEVRSADQVEPGFEAGVRGGRIVVTERWLEEAGSKDYGVGAFRQIAHEAMHVLASGTETVRGDNSRMIEEGAAEILSLDYWRRRGQPFDQRDAVRRDGAWTDSVHSLAAHGVYEAETDELLRRAASRVGWDRDAIVAEVRRVMAGDHNARLEFRDRSHADFGGSGVSAEDRRRWLLGDPKVDHEPGAGSDAGADFDPADHDVSDQRVKLRAALAKLTDGETFTLPGARVVAGADANLATGGKARGRRYRVHGPDGHIDVYGSDAAALLALNASARSADPRSPGGAVALSSYIDASLTPAQFDALEEEATKGNVFRGYVTVEGGYLPVVGSGRGVSGLRQIEPSGEVKPLPGERWGQIDYRGKPAPPVRPAGAADGVATPADDRGGLLGDKLGPRTVPEHLRGVKIGDKLYGDPSKFRGPKDPEDVREVLVIDPDKGRVQVSNPWAGIVFGNRNRAPVSEWLNVDSSRLRDYRQAGGWDAPEDDRGGLEAPYSYGGRHGLPQLQPRGADDRFELRFRDDAALVMWDKQLDKPHAIWDSDWDLRAIEDAVDESNIGARNQQLQAPTGWASDADIRAKVLAPTAAQMRKRTEPETLVEGLFAYDPSGSEKDVRGRAATYVDDAGVMHLNWYFFRQAKPRREAAIYRHIGSRLEADWKARADEDLSVAAGARDTYAALNSDALRSRLEALEPARAARVAEEAVRQGLPLADEARAWLSARGHDLEPGTHDAARGVDPETVDPPELVDGRRLRAQLNADPGMRARWHFVLPERGFTANTDILDAEGRATGGYVVRNPETGVEFEIPAEGDVSVRLNRGDRVTGDVEAALAQGEEGRARLYADGWVTRPLAGSTPGRGWTEFVHPDGRAFDARMRPDGTYVLDEARTYDPPAAAVVGARAAAIRRDPVKWITPGMDVGEVRRALRADWVRAEGMPVETVGFERWTKRSGRMEALIVKLQSGKVERVGYGLPEGEGADLVRIVDKPEHDRLLDAMIERQKREAAEAEARKGVGAGALSAWLDDVTGTKAPRGGHKLPPEIERSLVEGRNMNEVAAVLKAAGWESYKSSRRWSRTDRTFMGLYKLRGKAGTPVEGASLEIRGPMLRQVEAGSIKLKVSPNPQGKGAEARERIKGRAWADIDELYRDALGRADELGERFDAKVFVTAIRDESAGSAAAHHEWNGTIVMGTGPKTRFKQKLAGYLERRAAGTATLGDHQEFYDALSTLQHEINHGVGKAGDREGGLAFGSRHYQESMGTLSHTGVMEEALTEESARLLTTDWLRAQGMTDVLEAVKRMSPSDSRYRGSYTGYRDRLRVLFDMADVPEDERSDLILRMKFQMGPEERGRFLDNRIRAHVARLPEDERRALPGPIARDMPGGRDGATVSPGELIMAMQVFGGGGGRGKWGRTHSKDPNFRPVVDDPLEDVTITPLPFEVAKVGDRVRLSDGREGVIRAEKRFETGWAAGNRDVTILRDDGSTFETADKLIVEVVGGATLSPLEPQADVKGGTARRGSWVDVQAGDEMLPGVVEEVMDPWHVKVRTEDGLALWYDPDRLRMASRADEVIDAVERVGSR